MCVLAHPPGGRCGKVTSSNGATPQRRRETMTATARQNHTAPLFAFAVLMTTFSFVMIRFA